MGTKVISKGLHSLTAGFVNRLPFAPAPARGDNFQILYRDAKLKGFGLRVGTGSKVYYAETKIRGRTVRVTIGQHGAFTAEEARKEARRLLGSMTGGTNPNDQVRATEAASVTLRDAFDAFLQARKQLKPRTIYDYRRFLYGATDRERPGKYLLNGYLSDWLDRRLLDISKDMVQDRHAKIGEASHAQANLAMRFLRTLFNFAEEKYTKGDGTPLITMNPVRRLTKARAWYAVERRGTFIKEHQLKDWFKAVQHLKSDAHNSEAETVRDYLTFLMLTGLRRGEAARLLWSNVDLKARTFLIPDPKNGKPHTLPLSDYLLELLSGRKKDASSEYVFPGPGRLGYIIEPKKQKEKVIDASGVEFTLHDLRRTFATTAERLDVSAYALKRLLNHAVSNGDVTAGYIGTDVERLREPMQKVTNYMLRAAGLRKGADVREIPQRKRRA